MEPAATTRYSISSIPRRLSAMASVAPEVRTPIRAMRRRPTIRGLVTATTWIVPVSMRRWTRWRAAASDRPTAEASRV